MKTPRSVDISITSLCNLRCSYCYFFGNPSSASSDLSTDEWLTFFDELGALSVMDVCMGGGEPFLRPDLAELINGIVKNGMRFSIISNGTLVSESIASVLAETGRLNYVQISLDSAIPSEHDHCRGEGSWEGAVRGIRILKDNGINVTVRVTIHRHNFKNIRKTVKFILEELGLPFMSTNSAGYIGTCRLNAQDVLLTTRDREHVMSELLEMKTVYGDRIRANAGPLSDALMWRKMESARLKREPAFGNGGRLTACGCVKSKISVGPDGSINPCNQLTHINLGRINSEHLSEVWHNHPELMALRNRTNISMDTFKFCQDCHYVPYCTGNCPSRAYEHFGTTFHPSPDSCLRTYLLDGGRIA